MLKLATIVAVGGILAGCSAAGGFADEQEGDGGTPGGEHATVPEGRAHIAGTVTTLERAPGGETASDKRILIEEHPRGCLKSDSKEGCDRLYLDVTEQTRIFLVTGDDEALVRAEVADLARGQRVRAWHTGVLSKSYPGQGRARVIVVDATDASAGPTASPEFRR